jgi:hypothetical protein
LKSEKLRVFGVKITFGFSKKKMLLSY